MIADRARTWTERARRVANAVQTGTGRAGLRHGVAPTVEPQPMLRRLDPALVIDVGANRGQFALDVVTACPSASVVSFEPLPEEAEVYEAVLGHRPRVHLIRAAIGDRTGTALLHVSAAADSSSLHRPTELQAATFPGTHRVGEVEVSVCRLDGVDWPVEVPQRTLLKIDVQGHELAVLRGAPDLLGRIRWVYVEVSFVELYEDQALAGDVATELARHGYAIADLSTPTRRGGRTVQVDVLFERADPT